MKHISITRKATKTAACFWALTVLLGACGCSGGSSANEIGDIQSTGAENSAETMSCAYKTEVWIEAEEETYYDTLCYQDGTPYALKAVVDTENDARIYEICSYDTDGNETVCCTPAEAEGDITYILDFVPLPDGTFAVLYYIGENPDMAYEPDSEDFDWDAYYDGYVETGLLQIMDGTGTVQNSGVPENTVSEIEADHAGNLFLFGSDYASNSNGGSIVWKYAGNSFTEITAGLEDVTYLYDAASTPTGGVVILCEDGGDRSTLKTWNGETETFETLEADTSELSAFYNIVSSADPDVTCYISNVSGLYAVSSDGSVTETMNLANSNLSDLGFDVVGLENGEFLASLSSGSGYGYLAKLTVNEDAGDTQIITIATVENDVALTNAVAEFNNAQNTYHVSIIDYSIYNDLESENEDDWNKAKTVLNEDIAAGNIPDLINTAGIDCKGYAEKGLFRDLYDFMETDEIYTKDAFVQNYLTANEVEGSLYWISNSFAIDTVIVNDNLTGGLTDWDLQEFVDICRSCDQQGVSIEEYQSQYTFAYGFGFCHGGLLDFAENTCHFDDEAFLELLRFSEEMTIPDVNYSNMTQSEYDAYKSEEQMKYQNGQRLLYRMQISDFNSYATMEAWFGDEPTTIIGYPTLDGSGGNYIILNGIEVAVTSACTDTDGAWAFIRFMLEDTGYFESWGGFSVLQDRLEESVRSDAAVVAEEGDYTMYNVKIKIDAPTEEEIEAFLDFVLSVDKRDENGDTVLDTIAYEELDAFCNGDQTAEETAQLLQEKCGLYLKENG